ACLPCSFAARSLGNDRFSIKFHYGSSAPMARVTVEDCIDKVENRFDLVLLAAHRARMISSGAPITVERDNDKNPVVALREIADTTVSPEDLREELVHSLQKYVEVDEPEPEAVPLIGGEGVDVDDTEVVADRMTEEELLRGLEGLTPPEQQPEPMEPDEEEGSSARAADSGPVSQAAVHFSALPSMVPQSSCGDRDWA